jgi:hypothetical protein
MPPALLARIDPRGEIMSDGHVPLSLESTYLRLRGDVSIEALAVDDSFWPRLMRGDLGNFHNKYLVTVHDSIADWKYWEMHRSLHGRMRPLRLESTRSGMSEGG